MLGYSWSDVCYFAGKCSDISWKFVPPWFDFPEIFLFSSDFLVKFESFLGAQIVPTQHHQDLTFNLDFIIKRYQFTAYKEDYNQKLQKDIYKAENISFNFLQGSVSEDCRSTMMSKSVHQVDLKFQHISTHWKLNCQIQQRDEIMKNERLERKWEI